MLDKPSLLQEVILKLNLLKPHSKWASSHRLCLCGPVCFSPHVKAVLSLSFFFLSPSKCLTLYKACIKKIKLETCGFCPHLWWSEKKWVKDKEYLGDVYIFGHLKKGYFRKWHLSWELREERESARLRAIQVEEILFEEGKNQCLKGSKNLCLKKKEQRDSHVCQDLGEWWRGWWERLQIL